MATRSVATKNKIRKFKLVQPVANVIVKSYAAAAKTSTDEVVSTKILAVAQVSDKVKQDLELLVQRLESEKEQLESRMKLIEAKVETQAAAAVEKMRLENDTKVVEMKHEIKKIHDQQVVNNAKNSEIINLLKVLEENRSRDATLMKQIMGIADSQSDK